MIIDFHTHCFPDALAPRAISKLCETAHIKNHSSGTLSGLIESMDRCGIDKSVVCNVVTNTKQQHNVNEFAKSINGKDNRIFSLGSVHPFSDDIEQALCDIKASGLKGVKIHPDYTGVYISDPHFSRIFEICQSLGLFVIIHAGLDELCPNDIHAKPADIVKAVRNFPRLRLIAAHNGGNCCWEDDLAYISPSGVYFDTSLSNLYNIDRGLLTKIILGHDPDRILFGSDSPWDRQDAAFKYIDSLLLPSALKEKIFSQNALSLLEGGN